MFITRFTTNLMHWLTSPLLLILSATVLAGCGVNGISQETWGRVISLLVKEGDLVTKGQVCPGMRFKLMDGGK